MKLVLNTVREGYGTDQVGGTMTAGELIRFLEDYDEDTPIFLSFDKGYTYGSIMEKNFDEIEDDDDEE